MASVVYFLLMAIFVASIAARTVNIEWLSVSVTEETDDTSLDVKSLLEDVFGGRFVMDGDNECVGASCCVQKYSYNVCFTASVISDGVHVELTVNKQSIVSADITDKGPKEVCKDNPISKVQKVCLEVTNFSLAQLSGCVVGKATINHRTGSVQIGCFKLKKSEILGLGGQVTENDETDAHGRDIVELSAETILKFKPSA